MNLQSNHTLPVYRLGQQFGTKTTICRRVFCPKVTRVQELLRETFRVSNATATAEDSFDFSSDFGILGCSLSQELRQRVDNQRTGATVQPTAQRQKESPPTALAQIIPHPQGRSQADFLLLRQEEGLTSGCDWRVTQWRGDAQFDAFAADSRVLGEELMGGGRLVCEAWTISTQNLDQIQVRRRTDNLAALCRELWRLCQQLAVQGNYCRSIKVETITVATHLISIAVQSANLQTQSINVSKLVNVN